MTPFDELRHGYASDDPNAIALRRQLASQLSEFGEVSLPFYELLLIEAEHVGMKLGQWCRSESLLRRAVLIADQLGDDPKGARKELDMRYRYLRPSLHERDAFARMDTGPQRGYVLFQAEIELALMRYDRSGLDFNPTPPMTERIYLIGPPTLLTNPEKLARAPIGNIIEAILADSNRRLAEQEPTDANFIGVQRYEVVQLEPAAVPTLPSTISSSRVPVYLPSVTFLADFFGYVPLPAAAFIERLHAL
jgi:hypothetical protein